MYAVWRVMRKEGACVQRQRSWCVSTNQQFAAKAADIIARYLNPPEKALVISVDEKPSIQAMERAGSMGRPTTARSCEATRARQTSLHPQSIRSAASCDRRDHSGPPRCRPRVDALGLPRNGQTGLVRLPAQHVAQAACATLGKLPRVAADRRCRRLGCHRAGGWPADTLGMLEPRPEMFCESGRRR